MWVLCEKPFSKENHMPFDFQTGKLSILEFELVFKNWINIFSRRGSEMFWLGRLWNIVSMIIEWLILFVTSISYAINTIEFFLSETGQMCEGNILYLNLSFFFSIRVSVWCVWYYHLFLCFPNKCLVWKSTECLKYPWDPFEASYSLYDEKSQF